MFIPLAILAPLLSIASFPPRLKSRPPQPLFPPPPPLDFPRKWKSGRANILSIGNGNHKIPPPLSRPPPSSEDCVELLFGLALILLGQRKTVPISRGEDGPKRGFWSWGRGRRAYMMNRTQFRPIEKEKRSPHGWGGKNASFFPYSNPHPPLSPPKKIHAGDRKT